MNEVNRRQVLRFGAIGSCGLAANMAARAQGATAVKLAIVSMVGHDVDVVVSEA